MEYEDTKGWFVHADGRHPIWIVHNDPIAKKYFGISQIGKWIEVDETLTKEAYTMGSYIRDFNLVPAPKSLILKVREHKNYYKSLE